MHIHFIGIGGIGVSALAQYYLEKGHQISGSDLASSEITEFLAKKGIKVLVGNSADHIEQGMNVVIYSPAVPKDNPEYAKAQSLGIVLKSYPEALGELTREYTTIAISGAHGKSTTTAMTALILIKAGIDPTVIVGTKLKEFNGSNFRMGKSQYLVIEACEYDSSFSQYFPKIAVVTNVDKEHLDYFKTFKNVIREFRNFIVKLPADGWLVFNNDDKFIPRFKRPLFAVSPFSLRQKDSVKLKKILKIPGKHNILNALAALSVARILRVEDSISFASLSEYTGSWRRFDVKQGIFNGKKITVVGDYGHHPTEILATLRAAREKYPRKKIWCVFQPHQFQRTFYLFKDFIAVFKKITIDHVIITDIYDVAGREEIKINQSVSVEKLVKRINRKNTQYMPLGAAEQFVKENIKNGEVLIIMGAGDVYKLADKF